MISLPYIGTGFSFKRYVYYYDPIYDVHTGFSFKRYVYYYMIPYMMFIHGHPYVCPYMTVIYDRVDLWWVISNGCYLFVDIWCSYMDDHIWFFHIWSQCWHMMIIYDLSVYDLRHMIWTVYDLRHMIICAKPYMIWTYDHMLDLYMIIYRIWHMIPYMVATSNHIPKSDEMLCAWSV